MLATAHRKGGLRLTLVNKSGQDLNVAVDDLEDVPVVLGNIQLPGGFAPQRREWRNEVAKRLRQAKIRRRRSGPEHSSAAGRGPSGVHPAELDPDFRHKLRVAGEAERVAREIGELERRVKGKNQSLGHDFDRVLAILSTYGYVELDSWTLTEAGDMLARDVSRVRPARGRDFGTACSTAWLLRISPRWSRSSSTSTAARSRRRHRGSRRTTSASAGSGSPRSARSCAAQEALGRAREHRPPDPTFAAIAHAWVAGEGFAEVVTDEELTGGDFVRAIKQLIDILRQLAVTAPSAATRRAAGAAAQAAFRGVVADSSAPTEAAAN